MYLRSTVEKEIKRPSLMDSTLAQDTAAGILELHHTGEMYARWVARRILARTVRLVNTGVYDNRTRKTVQWTLDEAIGYITSNAWLYGQVERCYQVATEHVELTVRLVREQFVAILKQSLGS